MVSKNNKHGKPKKNIRNDVLALEIIRRILI